MLDFLEKKKNAEFKRTQNAFHMLHSFFDTLYGNTAQSGQVFP